MDSFSPAAPAAIRVQVLPVGNIEPASFNEALRRMQQDASVLTLAEIDKKTRSQHLLAPKACPQGSLFFNFTTSTSSAQDQHLAPFELFRDPLLVLGIADGLSSNDDVLQRELKDAAEHLRERYPRVVHRQVIVLQRAGVDPYPAMENVTVLRIATERFEGSDGTSALRDTMCNVAAGFLAEFSTYAKAMQATPGVQTPGQTAKSLQKIITLWGDEVRTPASGSGSQTPTPTQSNDIASPTGEEASRPPSRSFGSPPPPPATTFEQIQATNRVPAGLTRSDSAASNRSKGGKRASSQDRVSVQGFGPGTSQSKARERGKARVGIVIGHIYMMAGQWSEGLRILAEHTNVTRKLADNLWHGKGLEGIVVCMLSLAWARLEFSIPSICYPVSERNSAGHAQKFSVNLPSDFRPADAAHKAAVRRLSTSLPDLLKQILSLYSSPEGPLELPFLVIAEAKIRFCNLMTILLSTDEKLDETALATMFSRQSNVEPKKFSVNPSNTSLSKAYTAALVAEAQPSEEDDLPISDHINLLTGVYGVFAALRMDRKKSFVLKEIISKLTVALNQARKLGAAEAGIHPAASFSADTGADAVRRCLSDQRGTTVMIKEIAEKFGIRLTHGKGEFGTTDVETRIAGPPSDIGNDTLKFEVMRVLIAFCETSPDPLGVIRIESTFLTACTRAAPLDFKPDSHTHSISREEQARHASSIARTIGISKQLGLKDVQASYWDPFLLRGLEVVELDANRQLIPWRPGSTKPETMDQNTPSNPLLYDPNASRPGTAAQAPCLLVCNERQQCIITVQNPLDITIEIESVQVETEAKDGMQLMVEGFKPVKLGPRRFQRVSFFVVPSFTGKFNITGCRIKLASCREDFFPIFATPWAPRSQLLVKNQGQSANDSGGDLEPMPKGIHIAAQSVSPIPLLTFEHLSSEASSLMLLDGEEQKLYVAVRNAAQSGAAAIVKIVDDCGVLQFSPKCQNIDSPHPLEILQPGESSTLPLDVCGVAGVSETQLNIFYGPYPIQSESQFARMLSVPFRITVDAALQVHHAQIVDADVDHFIFAFDLVNSWPKPLYYRIELEGIATADEGLLAPGETTRINLRMARWVSNASLPDSTCEELLSRISVFWRTWEGRRFGKVNLRGLMLSQDQLDIVRGRLQRMHLQILHGTGVLVGSYLIIRVTLFNGRLSETGALLVELRLPLNTERRIASIGVLHRVLPPIPALGKGHVDFMVCPLMAGEVGLLAFAQDAQADRGSEDPQWHTKSTFVFNVADKGPVR